MKEIFVKSVLNKHKKRDEWFLDDYSLNPYLMCDFSCIYCYVRRSKYGEGKKFAVKMNAPTLLSKELRQRARKKEYGFIALSSATEPWMRAENDYKVTRKCLEVISTFKFPVHCLTKSTLILRDLDLLEEIDKNAILPADLKLNRGVLITVSLSTLDDDIAKIFEPNAPRPKDRLEVLQAVKNEGFRAGIAYIPVLPFISDCQLKDMIKTAKDFEADYVFVGALSLYAKDIYYRVLEKHYPELLPKYCQLFKGGYSNKNYQKRLDREARRLCAKYGVKYMIT